MQGEYRLIGDHVYKLTGVCDSSKCSAWCCHFLVFVVDPSNPDDLEYYLMHGTEARMRKDGKIAILVHQPCKHLGPTGLCGKYETRPWICRRYASLDADTFKSEKCTTRWALVTGREAQVALSRIRSGG